MFLVQGVVHTRAAADILKNRNFSHTWTYSATSVRHAITRQKDSLIFTLWGISHKGNLTIANQRIYRQASSKSRPCHSRSASPWASEQRCDSNGRTRTSLTVPVTPHYLQQLLHADVRARQSAAIAITDSDSEPTSNYILKQHWKLQLSALNAWLSFKIHERS